MKDFVEDSIGCGVIILLLLAVVLVAAIFDTGFLASIMILLIGGLVGYIIIATIKDIKERKRIEDASRKEEEAQKIINNDASENVLLKIYLFDAHGMNDPKQWNRYVTKKISDGEFYTILKRYISRIDAEAKSLTKLNIDLDMVSEIPPVKLEGFVFGDADAVHRTKNGAYVSNLYQISWLYFSDTQIYIYSYTLDLFDVELSRESTEEYFYKDVTSITTATETLLIEPTATNGLKEPLKVSTNSLHIVVPGNKRTISVSGVSNAEEIIQGIQQKVREKKMA